MGVPWWGLVSKKPKGTNPRACWLSLHGLPFSLTKAGRRLLSAAQEVNSCTSPHSEDVRVLGRLEVGLSLREEAGGQRWFF